MASQLEQILTVGGTRTPSLTKDALVGQRRVFAAVHASNSPCEDVGVVTSGCPSPSLGHPIAMAYVPASLAEAGTDVEIDLGGGTPATVTKLPFLKK